MSIALAFDTHEFITTLESSGMPKAQAEAQAHALRRALDTVLAGQAKTYQETVARGVSGLDTKTEKSIALLRKDVDTGFALVHKDMEALQNKLLIKLSLVMVGLVGLLVTAQRFFPPG